MNALKMCLNWKVIAGVAVVAVGLFVYAPGFALAALPFLVLAICPLSMVFMMGMMNGDKGESGAACSKGSKTTESFRPSGTPAEQLASLEAQQQELAREIATLQSDASRTQGTRPVEAPAAAR